MLNNLRKQLTTKLRVTSRLSYFSRCWKLLCLLAIITLAQPSQSYAQYVHTNGTQILDENGNELFFTGMNLGNWLLWEGYLMMGDFNYRTHTQFFDGVKLAFGDDLGQAIEFEHQWRMNYVTQHGIDELKGLGFNSVRVPFHFNLFWDWNSYAPSDRGFQYIDRVVEFCRNNDMYVLLDMHAAPGYQNPGDHSDNVESNASQPRETVHFWDGDNVNIASAVWRHIADYYKNEPVIWGYDLINEPVPQPGREFELLGSMVTMRNAIREVDNNHIIVAEGSWWGSDMEKLNWNNAQVQSVSGVSSRWDDNMVYQTHHYSSDVSLLDGRLALCNNLNVPLILGEYGESDNGNLRNMTNWCQDNNVGYFPWSFKKMSHDRCLWTIPPNNAYNELKNAINGNTSGPSSLYNDMIAFCNNNISNGSPGIVWHQGFYDAVRNTSTPPQNCANSSAVSILSVIQAEGYCNMNGIQTEPTSDTGGGENVGWVDSGDWLDFRVNVPSAGTYNINVRVAADGSANKTIDIQSGGSTVGSVSYSATGGWQNWATVSGNVNLAGGDQTLRIYFGTSGQNVNWFQCTSTPSSPSAPSGLSATAVSSSEIALNWADQSNNEDGFTVQRSPNGNGNWSTIATLGANATGYSNSGLSAATIYHYRVRAFNGAGNSGWSNTANATTQSAATIDAFSVIQAEDNTSESGTQTETTSDTGGGLNVGWIDANDYLAFENVDFGSGAGSVNIRLASNASFSGSIEFRLGGTSGSLIGTVATSGTGGWQSWITSTTGISGASGVQNLYLVFQGGSGITNVNWLQFSASGNPPLAPSNLSATAQSTSAIGLTWSDNANNEDNYQVQRSPNGSGSWSTIATLGANSTSYSNTGLSASTAYFYRVRATNSHGNSGWSNTESATTQASSSGIQSGGIYRINSRVSGKVLDVSGVSTNNGARIHQWDWANGDNQKWIVTNVGGSNYSIVAVHSNKALDVVDVSTADNAEIQQWDYNGGTNQQWRIEDVGSGYYQIVASHSNKALDVPNGSQNNGTLLVQYAINGGQNQHWQFELLGTSTRESITANVSLVQAAIKVYPNPVTNGVLNIDFADLNAKTPLNFSMVDMLGKIVMERNLDLENSSIMLPSDLQKGMYVVRITDGTKELRENVVVR